MATNPTDAEIWFNILLGPTAIIISALIALYFGHKYWRKQKREEGIYLQEQTLYKERLNAGKVVWALLRYISETDHDDNIFRRGELDKNGDKIYYFRSVQAKKYIEELNDSFYNKGYGIYLDSEMKNMIFELRSQIYAWYHIVLKTGNDEMPIMNKEKLKRVWDIRSELNKKLKTFIKIENMHS